MVVPRYWKESMAVMGMSVRVRVGMESKAFFKSMVISTVFWAFSSRTTAGPLPPVGRPIPMSDEFNQGGVICKLNEITRLVARATALGVHGKEQIRKHTSSGGFSAGDTSV